MEKCQKAKGQVLIPLLSTHRGNSKFDSFHFPLATIAILIISKLADLWIPETFALKRAIRKLRVFLCCEYLKCYVQECTFITELKVMLMRIQCNSALSWTLCCTSYYSVSYKIYSKQIPLSVSLELS